MINIYLHQPLSCITYIKKAACRICCFRKKKDFPPLTLKDDKDKIHPATHTQKKLYTAFHHEF